MAEDIEILVESGVTNHAAAALNWAMLSLDRFQRHHFSGESDLFGAEDWR